MKHRFLIPELRLLMTFEDMSDAEFTALMAALGNGRNLAQRVDLLCEVRDLYRLTPVGPVQ